MTHFTITYDPGRRKLTIYHNKKILCGLIGRIAEERFHAIKAEFERLDVLKNIEKTVTNGHKTKKEKI